MSIIFGNIARSRTATAALIIIGILLGLLSSRTADSAPLIVLGVALVMLGAMVATLPERTIASNAMKSMLGGALFAVDCSLEQVAKNFNSRNELIYHNTVYLPPGDDGLVYAFVPTDGRLGNYELKMMQVAPIGFHKDAQGMRVIPLGGDVAKLAPPTGEELVTPVLSEALEYALVDQAQLCSTLKLAETGNDFIVEMTDLKVDADTSNYSRILGSPPASLGACVIAALLDKPIIISEENRIKDTLIVRYKEKKS